MQNNIRFSTFFRPINVIFAFLLLFLLPFRSVFCAEAPATNTFNFDATQGKIKEIASMLKNGATSSAQIDTAKQQIDKFSNDANVCISTVSEKINQLDQELTSLGPPVEHEATEIVKERKNLARNKQSFQVTLSECRLISTLTVRLQNELVDQTKILKTATFFTKTDNYVSKIANVFQALPELNTALIQYVQENSGLQGLTAAEFIALLAIGFSIFISSIKGCRFFRKRVSFVQQQWHVNSSKDCFIVAVSLSCLAMGTFFFHLRPTSTLTAYLPWLLFSATFYGGFLFLSRHTVYRKDLGISSLSFSTRISIQLLSLLSAVLFFLLHLNLKSFENLQTLFDLFETAAIIGICVAGWWIFWMHTATPNLSRVKKTWRLLISSVGIFIIFSEMTGYRNFAIFFLTSLLETLVILNLLRFSIYVIDDIFGGIFSGGQAWQQKTRTLLRITREENLTGIILIRYVAKTLAWSLSLFSLLQIWGLPETHLQKITAILINGFSFGGLMVSPVRIILGICLFACGWSVISWLQVQLEKQWLRQAQFSRSAKDTLVTMTGYAGFSLALIIGLTTAGVSFSNLAVIAGALSVGIGFGLQNIVNNFVSGLIILFERPVKRGDWISVGNTEGYVQKVSVRSTLIQTFDRSDVIVPNSELISNQVTNMMLNDNFGRLKVPIGVAYGSDTELVRRILLEIASANKSIINDGSAPKPEVFFLEFGESSLNFELRCYLINIDERIRVKSTINYEIDRAFRKHDISIPFPQRDLYIKEFPDLSRSQSDTVSNP